MGERVCKHCGKSLEHRDAKTMFCSKECKLLYYQAQRHARIPEKACVVCGKVFQPSNKRSVCCSDACNTKYKRTKACERSRERYQKLKKQKEPKICVVCGESFIPVYNKSICCSYACSKKRNKQKSKDSGREKRKNCIVEKQEIVKQCIMCGRDFVANKPWHIVCSEECRKNRKAELYQECKVQSINQVNVESVDELQSWECAPSYMNAPYAADG